MSPGFIQHAGEAHGPREARKDQTLLKEVRRNDREGTTGKESKREGEGGRSLNGDRPTMVPTKLLAVVRRFRESNLSCDHLRECLNELLGVGPETTSLRGLLSARHLVWECGPNRNKRRTETTAGRREAKPLSWEEARRSESTYLPVGLLLNPRSRLMDSSSPMGPMHACTYDTNRPAPASLSFSVSPAISFSFTSSEYLVCSARNVPSRI